MVPVNGCSSPAVREAGDQRWREVWSLANGRAHRGIIDLLGDRRVRLASDNCRWRDVCTRTSITLSFIIMQIPIDKCFFLLRIRDHYLHFTTVHITCFYGYWLSRNCQNLLNCLSELLMAPGRRALVKGRGRRVSRSPQSCYLQLCSPE